MNFFVLGSEDVVLGFQFIGIKGCTVRTSEKALEEFNNVISGKYGEIIVLIITENASMMIEENVMKWQLEGNFPLIVEIPEIDGHAEGKKTLLESIRQTVGLNI